MENVKALKMEPMREWKGYKEYQVGEAKGRSILGKKER